MRSPASSVHHFEDDEAQLHLCPGKSAYGVVGASSLCRLPNKVLDFKGRASCRHNDERFKQIIRNLPCSWAKRAHRAPYIALV
jgi:hypothetical protein